MSNYGNKLFFFFFFIFILLTKFLVSGTDHNVIAKSACSATLYPNFCFSTVTADPRFAEKVATTTDVIVLSINQTIGAAQQNSLTLKNIQSRRTNLTTRQKIALSDCLELIDLTIDELGRTVADLNDTDGHGDDLKTRASAAITHQESCLDGFSHDDDDRRVRDGLSDGHRRVERMSSNVLAMIKNVTDGKPTVIPNRKMMEEATVIHNRKMMEVLKFDTIRDDVARGIQWPAWIPAADRRLLQSSSTVNANVVVAKDGSGDYTTVSEAVAAAPSDSNSRYVIWIRAGVYNEKVNVPSSKSNLMFVGDGRTATIITGSESVGGGTTTYSSATVAIVGEGFLARDLAFENTAGPSNHQAVALRVSADLAAFYRCNFLGYQDTLYVHSNRQFFVDCLVEGTVDFIFGNSAVVFQDCDIHPRLPLSGQQDVVTAQGRTDPNQNTGIVIHKSTIAAAEDLATAPANTVRSYLGRPWKEYSRTVVMQTDISDVIDPAGWLAWSGDFALSTLFYGEYDNTGSGSDTSGRVDWPGFRVITSASEAEEFTPENFISGSTWLPQTGFPYTLGLYTSN